MRYLLSLHVQPYTSLWDVTVNADNTVSGRCLFQSVNTWQRVNGAIDNNGVWQLNRFIDGNPQQPYVFTSFNKLAGGVVSFVGSESGQWQFSGVGAEMP